MAASPSAQWSKTIDARTITLPAEERQLVLLQRSRAIRRSEEVSA